MLELNTKNTYPQQLVRTVELRDGSVVTVRPIAETDDEIEREFIEGLSQHSNYLRFLGAIGHPTEKMIQYFTQIDYQKHMALIATISPEQREIEIAVGRFIALEDNTSCEFAIAVSDKWQGRGIGREIMKDLIKQARARGLTRMVGTILAENRKMIDFAKTLGFSINRLKDTAQIVEAELALV